MPEMFTPEFRAVGQSELISIVNSTEYPTVVNNKKIRYYNIPAAFDIETSSWYESGDKRASMYIWQFGIFNIATYGRTWDELTRFLNVLAKVLGLNEDNRLVVYVHNLAYEFQFFRKRFEWNKIFFLDERKPVYAITNNGIEFRCSLKLSSKKLEKVGQDLQKYKIAKMVGDLDYSLVRNSKTKLSDKEMGYCLHDIYVLLAYIQEKIENDGDITRIPLTNTGYVREYCRKACFARYKRYKGLMSELCLDPDEYSQLKRAFAGGFTHANVAYHGKVMENVASFDFTSSYPYVMLSEKFPMGNSTLVNSIASDEELRSYLTNYCCLMDITYHNIAPKVFNDYPISQSKCWNVVGETVNNGRIIAAVELSTTITEQDFFTIDAFYSYDSIQIHSFRIYNKAYLPKPLVMSILKFYNDKTVLKGIEDEIVNYMISKNMLNAAYGMMVTDIIRESIDYVNDNFVSIKPDLYEAIEKYNKSVKRFLFYPWGVWVTAYARANLFSGILATGSDYIYGDTDSMKILNYKKHMKYIESYNEQVLVKLDRAAKFHGLTIDDFSPANIKGVRKMIGVWDFEGVYDKFKTIGAKRYMTLKNGEYSLTVAGLNKSSAMKWIESEYADPFDGLKEGLIVPEGYSGRITSTYIDDETSGSVVDYTGVPAEYHELSSIHMEPSEYELTLGKDYKELIKYIKGYREDSW